MSYLGTDTAARITAAISQLLEHGAVMLTSDYGYVMGQSYHHGS